MCRSPEDSIPPRCHGSSTRSAGGHWEMVMRLPELKVVASLNYTPDNSHKLYWQFLVGGLEHEWIIFHILGISSSQLTNSYFSEGLKPPTRLYWLTSLICCHVCGRVSHGEWHSRLFWGRRMTINWCFGLHNHRGVKHQKVGDVLNPWCLLNCSCGHGWWKSCHFSWANMAGK